MNARPDRERPYGRLRRYREVAAILPKHGFGDLLRTLGLEHHLPGGLRGLARRLTVFDEASRPERVRRALEELGGTFVKAGQYLSTRSDLLPPDYLSELAKLQDGVAPFPAAQALRLIEEELGAPPSTLFKSFEMRPLAAASVAQVHAAVAADGTPVVVKVERPGLRQVVAADLDILAQIAALAERHSEEWRLRQAQRIVAEIARSVGQELDFALEAAHAERFARQFADDPTVCAPRVLRSLSSSRVLTLERIVGVKIDDLAALRSAGLDPRVAAERLGRHYLAMILTHGFFHADPHPGNLRVLPGHAIGYLDFGMMGRLDRDTRETLAETLLAVARRDASGAARGLLDLARYDEEPDLRAFEGDIAELLDRYAYRPLREWRLGEMLDKFFSATARYRVRVPAELFLMVKTISELESLARALDPGFDAVALAAPFVRRAARRRLSPRRLAEDLADSGREAARLLASAPADLREIIRQARRGRLLIEFEHKGLEPALSTLDRVSNRLAYSVLLAALVVGSSLLARASVPPLWEGMSLPGLSGFALSGLMAAWLMIAILRHGRL